jgi:hypothetical protein
VRLLPLRSIFSLEFVFLGRVLVVKISRSRFTDTITMNARLASEIFLSSLQSEFFSNL